MKSRLITLSIVAVVMASLSMTAQAIPISGAIAFSGGTTLNGSLASATAFTGYSDVQIATATPPTGTYAGLPTGVSSPSPITFADFTFNPVPVSSFVLWTFNYGGLTYSFTASSVLVNLQNSSFLNISGNGTASITGYDTTAGSWTITVTGSDTVLAFASSASVNGVPDGGTTVLLLGAALAALGLIQRRLA
jgi:hypothetical protein